MIFASSLGTVFEWYDFYIYGSLAAVISVERRDWPGSRGGFSVSGARNLTLAIGTSITVAAAVSDETGASIAVLDPLEGLADDAAGADYFSVMRANLATLRAGQGCR